jgi:hypothetical protein
MARETMHGGVHGLRTTFNNVADVWPSSAEVSFASTTVHFNPSRLIDAQDARPTRPTAKEGGA